MFIYSVETILTVMVIAICILIKVYCSISDWWKQKNCKHEDYGENSACEAICTNCGKNLGFIGDVRKRNKSL